MACLRFAVTIIIHLIIVNINAYTIDCETGSCQNTIINCLPNEDCFINCTSSESCYHTRINCPLNSGDCNILCQGGESCRSAIINATLSTGNFNLECEESTDHCRDITIYGSILNTNTGNYNIKCNGKQRSCVNANIQCPSNTDCNIQCNSDSSCRSSQIIGSNNGTLDIKCNGIKSCQDATFDGSKSLSLDINGCTNDESCSDLSLYCPPNINETPNCFIQGNNKDTKIYAINGWNDINIDYNGTFGTFYNGWMFCGENYGIKCEIASDNWTCINYNDYCNFNPTPSPILLPITFNVTNTNSTNISEEIDLVDIKTNNKSLLIIKIIVSISVITIICGFIICIKFIKKWFVNRKIKIKNQPTNENETDLFGFALKIAGSDQRDFLDENDISEPGRTNNIKNYKKSTIDPLDISYNYTQPLQQQQSITDNTYLSQPISELDSPNCIPKANRFSTDLSKYENNNRKISSDVCLNEQFKTPKPPPRNPKKNISQSNSEKLSDSEGISTIHTSQTTQQSEYNNNDSFSDIYDDVERKPTAEL